MSLNGNNNVFLTNDIIANEALRLLRNKLVMLGLVNRNLEQNFGQIGSTISVKKPFRTKSTSGRVLGISPMVDQTVALTINQQRNVGLQFTTNDRSLSIKDFSGRYLNSAVAQIAHQIDLSIALEAKNSTFFATGTVGNVTDFNTLIDARADATLVGVPDDGMVNFVLNPRDAAGFRKKLTTLANDSLTNAAIERAYLGTVAGMKGFETAQIPTHTVGVATGTPVVNGAGQSGSTLVTSGWTNSITGILKAGDIFTIANVFSINPQTYQSTGMLQQFVVTADANSGASTGPATLSISPAINDGNQTTLDGEGNSISTGAYQNVTALPANGAAITVLGTGGSTRRENFMIHKDAITFAMVDLHLPETAVVAKRARDPETGLSLTLTASYDVTQGRETYRLDALWGVKNLYPELSRRVYGS